GGATAEGRERAQVGVHEQAIGIARLSDVDVADVLAGDLIVGHLHRYLLRDPGALVLDAQALPRARIDVVGDGVEVIHAHTVDGEDAIPGRETGTRRRPIALNGAE